MTPGQLFHQGRVVRFDELVEQSMLRLMVLVGGLAKCIILGISVDDAMLKLDEGIAK